MTPLFTTTLAAAAASLSAGIGPARTMPWESGEGEFFSTIAGLPVHPLVLHAAVVLLPLAALGLCALIVIPKWRKSPLDWLIVVGLAVGAGACFVAAESGEALAEIVGEPGSHAELGEQMMYLSAGLFGIGLVWYLMSKVAARKPEQPSSTLNVLSVIALVAVALNLVWMVRVGHTGAEAVWADQMPSATGTTAEGESDGDGSSPAASPSAAGSLKPYTMAEVATHDTTTDCWAVVSGIVFDLTGFDREHPGGPQRIDTLCGTDATDAFRGQHGTQGRPVDVLNGFEVGTLAAATPSASAESPTPSPTAGGND